MARRRSHDDGRSHRRHHRHRLVRARTAGVAGTVLTFLLWLLLLVVAWPLALLALVLYPVVWLLTIPFRLIGLSVTAVLELVRGIVTLPARVLRGPRAYRD